MCVCVTVVGVEKVIGKDEVQKVNFGLVLAALVFVGPA